VNHPYAVVRDALGADLGGIFERATKSATERTHALAANLEVDLGALEIGTDVVIEVLGLEEASRTHAHDLHQPALEWRAPTSSSARFSQSELPRGTSRMRSAEREHAA
jgi:hypothetical protein